MKRFTNFFLKTPLKYGLNPTDSHAYFTNNHRPIKILNGNPSYINMLDSLYGYNLVLDIKKDLNKFASASYKHNSPAGVAFDTNIYDSLYNARNCDSLSSFGDFIAVNDKVDINSALYLKKQVSDGIIAPSYTDEALEILQKKKKGQYIILKAEFDTSWNIDVQTRSLYGTELLQTRHNVFLNNITHPYIDSIKLGFNTCKYTQSNSIVIVYENKCIGICAGQQNRVGSIEIAGKKLNNYIEKNKLEDKIDYNKLVLVSDSFLPFKDNIDIAAKYNIKTIVSQSGSIRDEEIINYAKTLDIEFITFTERLFLH